MKIGIDLDDVLCQTMRAVIKFHNNIYETNLKIDDVINYSLCKIWGGTEEETTKKIHEFHKTDYAKNIKPVKGAREILEKIKINNELYIITARPFDAIGETEEWVQDHFPNIFSKIYFTDQPYENTANITKEKICNDIGIDIFIEDNLKNALKCRCADRKVYLFDYQWNQTDKLTDGVKRVYSWEELGKSLL